MPIIKWERLKSFVKMLKSMGYREISTEDLHYWIGREFGISDKTRSRIHKALEEYKFIRRKDNHFMRWQLCKNEEGGEFEENNEKASLGNTASSV